MHLRDEFPPTYQRTYVLERISENTGTLLGRLLNACATDLDHSTFPSLEFRRSCGVEWGLELGR